MLDVVHIFLDLRLTGGFSAGVSDFYILSDGGIGSNIRRQGARIEHPGGQFWILFHDAKVANQHILKSII
jgi:hypothetical protein